MNCLDFRRRCLAEPNHTGREFLLHASECENCARFAARARALETHLADAIRINVPEDLARRIKLDHRSSVFGRTRRQVIALAASILIVLAVAGGAFYVTSWPPPLQAAVKKHIEGEWESLVEQGPTGKSAVASVLSTIGGVINPESGEIKYASLCDLSEYGGAHLVVKGAKGPVLALILKEKYISKTRFMTMTKPNGIKIDGVLMPTSNGSMAIVGVAGEDLHAVDETIRHSVFWRL